MRSSLLWRTCIVATAFLLTACGQTSGGRPTAAAVTPDASGVLKAIDAIPGFRMLGTRPPEDIGDRACVSQRNVDYTFEGSIASALDAISVVLAADSYRLVSRGDDNGAWHRHATDVFVGSGEGLSESPQRLTVTIESNNCGISDAPAPPDPTPR